MSEDLKRVTAEDLFGSVHEKPGEVFDQVMERDGHFTAYGVYSAMGAHIVGEVVKEQLKSGKPSEINGIYNGGWAVSAMLWRRPDMGFHDLTMFALIGEHIVRNAFPHPVIMDAETGMRMGMAITDTVRVFDKMGVAMAHMEDQPNGETDAGLVTRRCGNLVGKTTITPEAMIDRIRTWLTTSELLDTSMKLMVRTDALTAQNGGIDDAIERAKMFMDVEARGRRPDVMWADAMIHPDDLEKWTHELHKHDEDMVLGLNYSPNKDWTGMYGKGGPYESVYGGRPPTYQDLRDLGFPIQWHTTIESRAAMGALVQTASMMAESGAEALWELHEDQKGTMADNPQGLTGVDVWRKFEEELGGEKAKIRFDESDGR